MKCQLSLKYIGYHSSSYSFYILSLPYSKFYNFLGKLKLNNFTTF